MEEQLNGFVLLLAAQNSGRQRTFRCSSTSARSHRAQEGMNAVHVDGEDPERDQKLEAFRQGKITLLSNASLLHIGAWKRPPGLAKGSYKRNTSQRVSTIRTFLNYEPVYPWESSQPSRFTRALLARDGIDPDSAPGEGEARKVLQALGRRKYKRLPASRQLAGAADAGVDSETLWNLSYGL